jgi:hypothetical protein
MLADAGVIDLLSVAADLTRKPWSSVAPSPRAARGAAPGGRSIISEFVSLGEILPIDRYSTAVVHTRVCKPPVAPSDGSISWKRRAESIIDAELHLADMLTDVGGDRPEHGIGKCKSATAEIQIIIFELN